MIAPPPMPNRPARKPDTTPPAMTIAASQATSLSETPAIKAGFFAEWSRRDVRQIRAVVHHLGQRIAQDRNVGAALDGVDRNVTAERARAGHAVEQAEDVTRHRVQPHAA